MSLFDNEKFPVVADCDIDSLMLVSFASLFSYLLDSEGPV